MLLISMSYWAWMHGPRTTDRDIARAYRSLMRQHHPDTAPPPATRAQEAGERGLLGEIMEAYAVLSDPARREHYDRNRHTPAGSSPGLGLRRSGPESAAGRGLFVKVSPLRWDVPARRWF